MRRAESAGPGNSEYSKRSNLVENMSNVVDRSLSAIDAQILALEKQLMEDSDSLEEEEPDAGSSSSNARSATGISERASVNEQFWATRGSDKSRGKKGVRKKVKLAGETYEAAPKKKSKKRRMKEAEAEVAAGALSGEGVASTNYAPAFPEVQPTQLRCECCRIVVNSEALLQEHLQGRKHVMLARVCDARAEGRYCEACEIAFTGPNQYIDHCKGKRHLEMMRRKAQ